MSASYTCEGDVTVKNTPEVAARIKTIEKVVAEMFSDVAKTKTTVNDDTSVEFAIQASGTATAEQADAFEALLSGLNDDTLEDGKVGFFAINHDGDDYMHYVGTEEQRAAGASEWACMEASDWINSVTNISNLDELQDVLTARRAALEAQAKTLP